MSRAYAVAETVSVKKSLGLATLMIVSIFAGITYAPTASATVSGDLEITTSINPRPDDYKTSWDSVLLTVQITNTGFFYNTDQRLIEWFICEGIQDVTSCYNDREDRGQGSLDPIPIGQSLNYTFTQGFNPNGDEGEFTLVYRFLEMDGNSSNDYKSFTINFTRSLVDIKFEPQNLLAQLTDVATYDNEVIMNTNTDYQMEVSGMITSCSSCGLIAGLGWTLYDNNGIQVATAETNYSDLPTWSDASFTRYLPPLNHSTEGRYTMEFGVMSSSGTPNGDLNSYNNLQSIEVVFDDTIDLEISSMEPAFRLNQSDPTYYFGNDSLVVHIANNGNLSVANPTVTFLILDAFDVTEYEETCSPNIIKAGEEVTCDFNIRKLGDKKFKVYVDQNLNEGVDAKPSDNMIDQNVNVQRGMMNPIIDQTNYNGIYNTDDTITFSARVMGNAAQPVSYSWALYGLKDYGNGSQIQVNASEIGLGDHYMNVIAEDSMIPYSISETAYINFTIFNSTNVVKEDWMSGTAVTRTHAESVVDLDYPMPGFNYRVGNDLSPLLRLSVDVLPTGGETDAGMDWMDFDLNLTKIIPDTIPRESIKVYQLENYNSTSWTQLFGDDSYNLVDNETLNIRLMQNSDVLIVGTLPTPEVDAGNVTLTKLPDGEMQVSWEPTGDLENPYFGGWKIFRIASPITASSYFPDPNEVSSEFVWNGLMSDTLSVYLAGVEDTWYDERRLETGICASYAVIPTDRAGEAMYTEAKVSTNDGIAGLTCGDSIDPTSQVTNFNSNVVYTNSTDCHNLFEDWSRCYVVTLSWTWPNHEPDGNLSWNLYRVEYKPNEVDLRYIEPIATDLKNIPGESATFLQNGTDYNGIRPYRTYYYILTPLDHIGNELTFIDYPSPNVERVFVEDQYWEFNQDRIPIPPPPPEPPYGVDWLGTLVDDMQQENFQIAGIIMLFTILINFIGLPLIIKKRKRLSRLIAKRKSKQNIDDNEFDDFFN